MRGEDGLVVGKIKVILIHRDSVVHFFVEKYLALCLPNLGVFCLPHTTSENLLLC